MNQFATCDDIVKTIRANDQNIHPGDYVIGWMDGPNSYVFFYGKVNKIIVVRSLDGVTVGYEIESASTGSLVSCRYACLFKGELNDEQT